MTFKLRAALLAAAGASTLAACSTMPSERPAPPPLPASWPVSLTNGDTAALTDWWKSFNDPLLDQLVTEGLERSPNVRLAMLRLKEARAQNRQTFGAFLPEISGTGRATVTQTANGVGLSGASETGLSAYGATVSWEIPLFSRIEAATIGARANARASIEDVRGARVSLAADVANAYVDLRTAQNRLAALREGGAIAVQLADILDISARAGITPLADAADARRQAESTKASLADAEIAARVAANQFSLLRARAPGTEPPDLATTLTTVAPVPVLDIAGVPAAPADLVRLRPDIARAEAQAIVAAAAVGVARSDLLPHLNLTGSLLVSDNLASSAALPITTTGIVTPIISIPLLDWGKRLATVDVSNARFDSALIAYETAVNQGIGEATTALTQVEQGRLRLSAARAAEQNAEITANGIRSSYSAGIASLFDRLRSDQQLLDARLQRIGAESSASKAAIATYRAFGGGPPDLR